MLLTTQIGLLFLEVYQTKMTILESSHTSTFVWLTYIFLFIKISLIIRTSVVFFNNGNLLSVYSDTHQSTLKYLKDTEANI